jgi:phosphoribosyl 1,2-cyclic phosphodiesterase
MRVTVLASGSRDNATLLEAGETRVLIDAGISPRKMRKLLRGMLGRPPESLDAVIITHGHGDHARHAAAAARSFDAALFATPPVVEGWDLFDEPRLVSFTADEPFQVGDLRVSPFALPHDSPQVALVFSDGNEELGIATDLGEVPPGLIEHLSGCETLLIESNHDVALLENGHYLPFLKRRILSSQGHISNEECAALLAQLPVGLREVVLMHLSEANNQPELALRAAQRALRGRSARISVASQNQPLTLGRLPTLLP